LSAIPLPSLGAHLAPTSFRQHVVTDHVNVDTELCIMSQCGDICSREFSQKSRPTLGRDRITEVLYLWLSLVVPSKAPLTVVADIPLLMGTYNLMASNKTVGDKSSTTKEASRLLQHFFAAFIRDPTHGLEKSYGLPTYRPNSTTLVELFNENKPSLTRARATDNPACANPTPIPWDETS